MADDDPRDGADRDPETAAEAWERVGRDILAIETDETRREFDDSFRDAMHAVRDDELTATEINALRGQLLWVREFIEEYLAPIADGAEPWDSDHQPDVERWYARGADEDGSGGDTCSE